jgi:hypothetical protein
VLLDDAPTGERPSSGTGLKNTCLAWRSIRPATWTSLQQTVTIIYDAHAA